MCLAHLSGLCPAPVESTAVVLFAATCAVFAARKWSQDVKDDIGDKSVFQFLALSERDQVRVLVDVRGGTVIKVCVRCAWECERLAMAWLGCVGACSSYQHDKGCMTITGNGWVWKGFCCLQERVLAGEPLSVVASGGLATREGAVAGVGRATGQGSAAGEGE